MAFTSLVSAPMEMRSTPVSATRCTSSESADHLLEASQSGAFAARASLRGAYLRVKSCRAGSAALRSVSMLHPVLPGDSASNLHQSRREGRSEMLVPIPCPMPPCSRDVVFLRCENAVAYSPMLAGCARRHIFTAYFCAKRRPGAPFCAYP